MTTGATTGATTGEPAGGDLPAGLLAWVGQVAGAPVVSAVRRPGGARHEAWLVDVQPSGGEVRLLFLRYDRSDPAVTGDPFTLHREACFYRGLQGVLPLPEVLGVHPVEQAVLFTRVAGETWFSRLTDEPQRIAVARDFMGHLAALHRVDPHAVAVPGQDPDAPLPVLVHRELDTWEALFRFWKGVDPLVEFALRWLRSHVPAALGPVVVVQGDTGPGNFLYADGQVTAVLDWELAHFGDPHDDLGWVALRAVQEPFTTLTERLADYSAASGREIDPVRLRFYRVFAEFRVVVLSAAGAEHTDPLGEIGNGLIYGQLHRRLLVEALAEYGGHPLEQPPALVADRTDREWLYTAALGQLREVIVPRSDDPLVLQRSKGLARVLKFLAEADRYAAAADAQHLADLTDLLGMPVAGLHAGDALLIDALQGDALTEAELIGFFSRQVARETALRRTAMGALADRHFDPLA